MLIGFFILVNGYLSLVRRSGRSYHPDTLMTELTLTAIFEEAEEGGYVGCVAELPGANTQGETPEEVRQNLNEAVELILHSNREEFEKSCSNSRKVIRERLVFRVV
jgi:predicted RNase H-like HicB family nuclease